MIRNRIYVLGFSLVLFCFVQIPTFAQVEAHKTNFLMTIERAIQRNDMSLLMRNASNQVFINILGNEKMYSNSQARFVLEEFFDSNVPDRFTFSEISEPKQSQFAKGYFESRGESFELYVRLRKNGKNWQLREIILSKPTS